MRLARGEFLQLTATAAEHVALAIEWSRKHPRAVSRKQLYEREARRERGYDAWAYDALDDAAPVLHGRPFVTVR